MNNNKSIPDYFIELYAKCELKPNQLAEFEKRLEQDTDLKKRLNKIVISNNDFRARQDRENNINQILSKTQQEIKNDNKKPIQTWQFVGAGILAIAAVFTFLPNILLIQEQQLNPDVRPIIEQIRSKGINPNLTIFLKKNNLIEQIGNEQLVKQNDELQLQYNTGGYEHGVIFSIDGRGSVTLHYPQNETDDTQFNKKGLVTLPYAYKLDDAPDYERFFMLTSHNKINLASVLKNANTMAKNNNVKNDAKIELGKHIKQYSILLNKE